MDPLNWSHILTEALVIVLPLFLAGFVGYLKLKWTVRQFPPHRHNERVGILYTDGVIYPLKEEKQ